MKKLVIFGIVILLVITAFLFFSLLNNPYKNISGHDVNRETENNPNVNTLGNETSEAENASIESSGGEGSGGGGSEGGGSSGGGSSAGAGTSEQENSSSELPSDIDSTSCSFYFENYGICAGTCPSGTCTQEGRSCYCKQI